MLAVRARSGKGSLSAPLAAPFFYTIALPQGQYRIWLEKDPLLRITARPAAYREVKVSRDLDGFDFALRLTPLGAGSRRRR